MLSVDIDDVEPCCQPQPRRDGCVGRREASLKLRDGQVVAVLRAAGRSHVVDQLVERVGVAKGEVDVDAEHGVRVVAAELDCLSVRDDVGDVGGDRRREPLCAGGRRRDADDRGRCHQQEPGSHSRSHPLAFLTSAAHVRSSATLRPDLRPCQGEPEKPGTTEATRRHRLIWQPPATLSCAETRSPKSTRDGRLLRAQCESVQIVPRGVGKRILESQQTRHARAACGTVPPAGLHVSV